MISNAKFKAYGDLYNRLDAKDSEKIIYKLVKLRKRKTKDLNYIKCIKGKDEAILVTEEEIKE